MKALDGLRGVAAISVMISHAGLTALRFRHGYLAVDLFFLLSGYVIAKCYEPALAGQPGSPPLGAGRYMLARLERLYPMLLLGGILGFGVFVVGMSDFVPANLSALLLAIVSQFFLLEPLSPTGYFIFNRVQWSIVSELTVNGVHAVALTKLNIPALWGIVSISIVGIVISVRDCGSLERTCSALAYPLGYSRVFFSFFAGVLIYRLKDLWSEKIPRISFAILALLLLIIFDIPSDWINRAVSGASYDVISVGIIFPLVVMFGNNARAGALAVALGTLSYPLYAIHFPLLQVMHAFPLSLMGALICITCLVIVAWAIGRWVDEPLNAWRRRTRSNRRSAPIEKKVVATGSLSDDRREGACYTATGGTCTTAESAPG